MANKREEFPNYIGVDSKQEAQMLQALGLNTLDDLYKHLNSKVLHSGLKMEMSISRDDLKNRIKKIASKNILTPSFIGDGLQTFKVPSIVSKVCEIRGLSTAYTPYQPERSQGTLQSLWIYQNLISKITGFEAINASLYERATCLYEALNCALRIKKKTNTVIVAENIYPGDIEVLNTQKVYTNLNIIYCPIDKKTGLVDINKLKTIIIENKTNLAAVAFSQINSFGSIENFNELTDLCHEHSLLAIAITNLHALSNLGLKEPARWGTQHQGADILVAEGQSLTLDANFGGPGLGIFGIRYNENQKLNIRSAAGRFIGKGKDINGKDCKTIILSTREQHIRREKATSNICSNQSFVATLCGAAILEKGSNGFDESFKKVTKIAYELQQALTCFEGVELRFTSPIFNEFTLKINSDIDQLIEKAFEAEGIQLGTNISSRCGLNENLLLISINDQHSMLEVQKIINFFKTQFKPKGFSSSIHTLANDFKRHTPFKIDSVSADELQAYYKQLGEQNLSPDDGIYPLGSCTMKYNPELNEWAAGLDGFTKTHPQSKEEFVQGNLQILFEIQELFKDITGLPAVTTQPVAGAQGELVGLKLFQAYHADKGEGETRKIILIPRSAHGTNPATAVMAGYEIEIIEANTDGEINFEKLESMIKSHQEKIAGVMITNPNTAGIFERNFQKLSELIHSIGGLVYMDGANMNAIAGWVDLNKLGVDAVHNNLHKTWSIPHGGGGPGDAMVAVSDKLVDFLPGVQIEKNDDGTYMTVRAPKSIGSFHRHFGNFAHKVRAYTYLKYLGANGIKRMSAIAVLNARYLHHLLSDTYPTLPKATGSNPRMHEFILTLTDDNFDRLAKAGTAKAQVIARVGKLFLDFGFHAPTVAFPEVYGLMLEPTESFTKDELDKFSEVVKTIHHIINEYPQVLQTVPHFTPIDRVDEVSANKIPQLIEDGLDIQSHDLLTPPLKDRLSANVLRNLDHDKIIAKILEAHEKRMS